MVYAEIYDKGFLEEIYVYAINVSMCIRVMKYILHDSYPCAREVLGKWAAW